MSKDKDTPDLQLFKADKQQEQFIQMKENLRLLKESMDIVLEYHQMLAQLRYSKFESLVKAGFSEAQALTIITTTNDLL